MKPADKIKLLLEETVSLVIFDAGIKMDLFAVIGCQRDLQSVFGAGVHRSIQF